MMVLALKEDTNLFILVSNGGDTGSGIQNDVELVQFSIVQPIRVCAL